MPNLKLLPEIKSLMLQSFRIIDFLRIDAQYTFSRQTKGEGMLDFEVLDAIRPKVEGTAPGAVTNFSNAEILFLYLSVDLLCKSYFSDAAPHFEGVFLQETRQTKDEYLERRGTMLTLSERFLAQAAQLLQSNPTYQALRTKLDQLTEQLLG